eukprot:COSAG01_NODE_51576_length_353_cov_2.988189_1_plen_63_part_10
MMILANAPLHCQKTRRPTDKIAPASRLFCSGAVHPVDVPRAGGAHLGPSAAWERVARAIVELV